LQRLLDGSLYHLLAGEPEPVGFLDVAWVTSTSIFGMGSFCGEQGGEQSCSVAFVSIPRCE